MKRLFLALLTLMLAAQLHAETCYDRYQDDLSNKTRMDWGDASSEAYTGLSIAGLAGGVVIGGIAVGLGALIVFPVATISAVYGARVGVKALNDIKEKKMMRLITEAIAYDKSHRFPGKLLKKLHKKIPRENQVSMNDLAKTIVEGNEDLSFCTVDMLSYKELSKAIKNGDMSVVELE